MAVRITCTKCLNEKGRPKAIMPGRLLVLCSRRAFFAQSCVAWEVLCSGGPLSAQSCTGAV